MAFFFSSIFEAKLVVLRMNPTGLGERVAVLVHPIEDDVSGYGHRDSSAAIFTRPANVAVSQVLVPSRAADGDGADVGEIARRDVAQGHAAIDTLAGILILHALPAQRIADLTFGTLDVLVHATCVGIAGVIGAWIAVVAVGV